MRERAQAAGPFVPVGLAIVAIVAIMVAAKINRVAEGAVSKDVTVYCAGFWGCSIPPQEWLIGVTALLGVVFVSVVGVAVYQHSHGGRE